MQAALEAAEAALEQVEAKVVFGQLDISNPDSSTYASKQLELDLFAVVESESLNIQI